MIVLLQGILLSWQCKKIHHSIRLLLLFSNTRLQEDETWGKYESKHKIYIIIFYQNRFPDQRTKTQIPVEVPTKSSKHTSRYTYLISLCKLGMKAKYWPKNRPKEVIFFNNRPLHCLCKLEKPFFSVCCSRSMVVEQRTDGIEILVA